VCEIAGIKAKEFDFNHAKSSKLFALDRDVEKAQEDAILDAKGRHDSVGGVVLTVARGVPKGLGEPIYYKLDACWECYDEYQRVKRLFEDKKMGVDHKFILGKFQEFHWLED